MSSQKLGWPLLGVAGLVLVTALAAHWAVRQPSSGGKPPGDDATRQQSTKSPFTPTRERRQPVGGTSRPSSTAWQDQAALPDLRDSATVEDGASQEDKRQARVKARIADLIAKGDVGERLEALLTLWRTAADAGVPEEAMQEFRIASFDPNPEIAALALRALEDLERLRESQSWVGMEPPGDEFAGTFDGDPKGTVGSTAALENVEDLATGLEQRVASFEEAAPEERLETLLELWRYAADSGVPERALEVTLICGLRRRPRRRSPTWRRCGTGWLRRKRRLETLRSPQRHSKSGPHRQTIPI